LSRLRGCRHSPKLHTILGRKPAVSKSQIALQCSLASSSIRATLMIRSRPAPPRTIVQPTAPETPGSSGTEGRRQWFGSGQFSRTCSISQPSSAVFARQCGVVEIWHRIRIAGLANTAWSARRPTTTPQTQRQLRPREHRIRPQTVRAAGAAMQAVC
jgi:hypothetical protein